MEDEIKKIKKKFFIIGFTISFLFWFAVIFLFIFIFTSEDSSTTCIEDGYCKEGISIKINSDTPTIINEQTCIENNGDWFEDKKFCILYHD